MDQDALGANLETGLLVSEDDYDAFYEQNQMLLNTEIEATPENLSMALSATEIHSFAKIVNLENRNIYVSFPEATFGEVYVSPNKKQKAIYSEHEKSGGTIDRRLQSLMNGEKDVTIEDLLYLVDDSEYGGIVSLLRKKKNIFDGINIKIEDAVYKIKDPNYDGRRAYYDSKTHTIHIKGNTGYINGDASSVILHEIMHALTVEKLKANKSARESF